MANTFDTRNQVSPTIGDTLSEPERQNLRQATQANQSQPQATGTYGQSLASKGYQLANQWHQSSVRRRIQEHPYKTAGLVILGSIIVRSLFSRKD